MPNYTITTIAPQHGALELTSHPENQVTVTRLSKKIHRYVS